MFSAGKYNLPVSGASLFNFRQEISETYIEQVESQIHKNIEEDDKRKTVKIKRNQKNKWDYKK